MAVYKVEDLRSQYFKASAADKMKKKEGIIPRNKNGDERPVKPILGELKAGIKRDPAVSSSNEIMDDLFQIGCIRLIEAIDNFDVNQRR